MKPRTERTLYHVQEKMKEARWIIDGYLYGGEEVPDADHDYLRKVYSKVCEVMDLL